MMQTMYDRQFMKTLSSRINRFQIFLSKATRQSLSKKTDNIHNAPASFYLIETEQCNDPMQNDSSPLIVNFKLHKTAQQSKYVSKY